MTTMYSYWALCSNENFANFSLEESRVESLLSAGIGELLDTSVFILSVSFLSVSICDVSFDAAS